MNNKYDNIIGAMPVFLISWCVNDIECMMKVGLKT